MLSRSECTDKSGVADGNCAAGFGLTNLYSSNIRLIGFNKSLFLFPADEKCRFSIGVVTILNPESGLAFVVLLQPPPAQLLSQPTSPMFRLVKSIFISEKVYHCNSSEHQLPIWISTNRCQHLHLHRQQDQCRHLPVEVDFFLS